MANSDKNILITPSVGLSTNPTVKFNGANNTPTTLRVLDDGTVSFEATAGQLFSIADGMTGTIFSVNDVSGIPNIEVLDTALIKLNQYQGQSVFGSSAAVANTAGNPAQVSIVPKNQITPGLIIKHAPENTATITNITGSGSAVTYTALNTFSAGTYVTITGANPSAYNLTNAYITNATSTQFTVSSTATGAYVSGGLATTVGPSNLNPIFEIQSSSGSSIFSIETSANNPTVKAFLFRANYFGAADNTITIGSYGGTFDIIGSTAASTILKVTGAPSQTAALQEWTSSTGTSLTRVRSSGQFGIGSILTGTALVVNLDILGAATQGIVIRGAASQTGDLALLQASDGTTLLRFNAQGQVQPLSTAGQAFTIKGVASQSLNLQEWQNSAGTVLASISSTGKLTSAVDASINGMTVGLGSGSISTNTAIGISALGSNTTGSGNTALGAYAGTTNTSTVDNTYIGRSAGYYSYGNYNVFIGAGAAFNGGSGSNNTYIGTWTGTGNNYSGCVFIGYNAGQNTTGNNQLVIANTSTDTPLIGGDFSAKTLTVAGNATITSQATGTIGLIVKGAASQTADLQQWQTSGGSVLANVDKNGYFRGPLVEVKPTNPGLYGIAIAANASQSGDLFQITDTSNNAYTGVSATGKLVTGNTTNASRFTQITDSALGQLTVYSPTASTKGIVVKGATSQTANLQEWQNSSGSVLGYITSNGHLNINELNGATSLQYGNSFGVLQTKRGIIALAGVSNNPAISIFGADSPTADLMTWGKSNGDIIGGITANAGIYTNLQSASQVGLIVKGAASQTADLQQWQNSAGTVLAKIDAYGRLGISTSILANSTGGYSQVSIANVNTTDTNLIIRGYASQTANLQEWQNSSGTVLAKVDKDGNNYANAFVTPGFEFYSAPENSGGFVYLKKETAAAANPGAGAAKMYFRDGTNAGTLKLVVRAGASGAETTILDNIPQS